MALLRVVVLPCCCLSAHLAVPPRPSDDTFPQAPDGPTIIPPPGVLGNDSACHTKPTLTIVTGPQHGVASLDNQGGFTYTRNLGQRFDDSFVYQVCVWGGGCLVLTLLCIHIDCWMWVHFRSALVRGGGRGGFIHS